MTRRLAALLGRDERERARRFVRTEDRRRFVVTRALVRTVLSRYVGTDPARLRFSYGAAGKPALGGAAGRAIRFNVSHCASVALLAVARDREVGVDLERVREIADVEALATTVMTVAECVALADVPPAERSAQFLRGWTCIEAVLKVTGSGLAGLDGHRPVGPTALCRGTAAEARWLRDDRWSVCQLTPARGFVGAVALAGAPCAVVSRRWSA